MEVLAIMAYTGRFRLEEILFSGFRYMKEPGCYYRVDLYERIFRL